MFLPGPGPLEQAPHAPVDAIVPAIVPASADVSFGASGSITAIPNVTGSAGVAFGASASLTAPTSIVPASAGVTFGASATITAPTFVAPASSGVTFSATGSITAPTSIVPAAAGVTFSATGAITSIPRVSGTSGVTFTGTGALTAPTSIVPATSGVAFSATGSLTAPTFVVPATAGVTFSGSGAITAGSIPFITGSSGVSFAATGSITAPVYIVGTKDYLNVPTASGASTPDQAGLAAGTGTLDLRAEIAPTSWSSGAYQAIVNQYVAAGGSGSRFGFWIHPTGKLEIDWYVAAASPFAASTVATGFTAGSRNWVRVLLNIAAGTVDFYTSSDGVTWTPLGTQVTGLSTATMSTAGTAPVVRIGTDADNEHCPGVIYRTQVLVAGSTILNMDWTSAATGSGPWTATSGETWTALGTASVLATVAGVGSGVTFGGSGTVTSIPRFAGSGGVTFSGSGAITASSAPFVNATSTGSVSFGASASLSAPGRVTGASASVTFAATMAGGFAPPVTSTKGYANASDAMQYGATATAAGAAGASSSDALTGGAVASVAGGAGAASGDAITYGAVGSDS